MISNLGRSKAQIFANASMESLEKMAGIIERENIDCDFHRLPLYIYSESWENLDKIKDELEAAKSLGLPASYAEDVPPPFKTGPAIKYITQAQFHPRKYLLGLINDLNGDGNYVFEKTRVNNLKAGEKKEVSTDQGNILADEVVIATHTPAYDPDSLSKHLHPARSYVLGYIWRMTSLTECS